MANDITIVNNVDYISWSMLAVRRQRELLQGMRNHCENIGLPKYEIDKDLELLRIKIQSIKN